ncbi:Gfo/Idh/MocA family protein [Paracoccus luteus]|uniref:Gfo/Idh/MocA family protein n=1 Tax=Paracoccus luteus TaxID=2508543 RepID=UPI001FE9414B|nr:Gfo/Idh/MocA family oxidoreductase [Paracoccus luteus]
MTATDSPAAIPLAVVGLGKIARDQHVPEINASPAFTLAATVDPAGGMAGVRNFADLATMLDTRPDIAAVALCTPPQVRFELARAALLAGRDVLLEKPPGVTVAEMHALDRIAADHGRVLFTAWHSQFAPGVDPARDWLAGRRVTGVEVVWREDVRQFHPGQDWIFQPGGTGVHDPGINALSVLTRILPSALRVTAAEHMVPANRAAPIAARVTLATEEGAPVTMDMDFREQGTPRWDMTIRTDRGDLTLSRGGAAVAAEGLDIAAAGALPGEYRRIYERFAGLIARRERDVDAAPFQLVADAFLLARWSVVEPFEWRA